MRTLQKWVGIAVVGIGVLSSQPGLSASVPNQTAWANGTNWEYRANFLGFPGAWVYTPNGYSPRVPNRRGLVFHLMGCGQAPFQVAQASGWPDAAEQYGLVIVVPGTVSAAHPNGDAPNVECLNYGYDGAYGVYNPSRTDADHAAIIAAAGRLATDASFASLAIDPDQVYVAGLSAGGAVAVQVGCMAPDLFAGVATAAAPGMGTAQGTAVMPPPAGFNKDSVKRLCTQWASSSPHPNASALLAQQVYAIVSDDNGLPAGSGPFDTSKFNNQRIWDGDKFCPHVYGDTRARAFSELLGVSATQTAVPLATGNGIGCPGGENSRGDSGEVECTIIDFVTRPWTALADIYTDANGYTRLVRIQQDTLRHSWPSGPLGALDFEATPTRTELRNDGYINTSTGEFDRSRMGTAPNGQYGTIYFNHQAMDFPMFVAELWTNNNPRLGPPGGGNQAPGVEGLAVGTAEANGVFEVTVTGTARDPDMDEAIQSVRVAISDAAGTSFGAVDVAGNGTNAAPFSVPFGGLVAGSYQVTIEITGADGAVIAITEPFTLGGPANQPPTVAVDAAAMAGEDCLTASGTAADADGSVARVDVTVLGLGPEAATINGGAWTYQVCGLPNGTYEIFAAAVDELGAVGPESPATLIDILGGGMETAVGTLTEHIDAGRVTRFTQQWMDLRDAHCTQVSVVSWDCVPFEMYRCEGDAAWTDARPGCGDASIGVVDITVGIAVDRPQATVGDELTYTVAVANGGPDAASAVRVVDTLPAALSFVRSNKCLATGQIVRCHLGALEAGGQASVEIVARATAPGSVVNEARSGSAQTMTAPTAAASVQISEPAQTPLDGGTASNPDAGSPATPRDGGSTQTPDGGVAVDAGTFGGPDDQAPSGCRATSPGDVWPSIGVLGLVFAVSTARRRRRR